MKKHIRKPSKHIGPSSDLFFKPEVQKKLVSGQPGDAFEVEADKMADSVVNNTSDSPKMLQKRSAEEEVQQKPLSEAITPWTVQKATKEEEPVQKVDEEEPVQKVEEEEPLQKQDEELTDADKEAIREMKEADEIPMQKKPEEESLQQKDEEEAVQKRELPPGNSSKSSQSDSASLEAKLGEQKGLGHPMDAGTISEMEQNFGADFSEVRIHTGSEAEKLSESLGAQAFTQGHDIFFNKDKYNPESRKGKHLLAHELTHTLQQKGASPRKVKRSQDSPVRKPVKNSPNSSRSL